jgi:tRNA pseudouridine32 synthase / 23S rRNA pseudouridine746 synthase
LFIPLSSTDWTRFEFPSAEFEAVTETYLAHCPVTGQKLSLPRTKAVESMALQLVQTLGSSEPKMYGVLLAQDKSGSYGVLRAFSGKLAGSFHHPGWVSPVFTMKPSSLEISTKRKLQELKEQLETLSRDPRFRRLAEAEAEWAERERELRLTLTRRKRERDEKREMSHDADVLVRQSQMDSKVKRDFKRLKQSALGPLRQAHEEAFELVRGVKSERKTLSRALQKELHQNFAEALWKDEPWSLPSLFPAGPPTGTGECCAPKLLYYAKQNGLTPIAMAEIWWGSSTEQRQAGRFYLACSERCQPLLGPLLSKATWSMTPIFEDAHLLAFEKPSGLLTVPGRESWNQDSLQRRAVQRYGELLPIHRLDLETSGIVLFAKSKEAQAAMQRLFSERDVQKTYQAILSFCPEQLKGTIDLPLSRDPDRPGCYRVWPQGKPAKTYYEVLSGPECRVEFRPLTGRSHQLRVHAAGGLGCPISGDRLYGCIETESRLKLHAQNLEFLHPFESRPISLTSSTPF